MGKTGLHLSEQQKEKKKENKYTWVKDNITDELKAQRPWLTPKHITKKVKQNVNFVDLSTSSYMPPVLDQGNLGTCAEFSSLSAFIYLARKQGLQIENMLSPLFLYFNVRFKEGTVSSDSGSQLSDVMFCLKQQGVCNSSLWPYNINKFRDKPPTSCYADGKKHTLINFHKIHQTMENIKNTLIQGLTIVFGFVVYSSFESNYTLQTGKMVMPRKGEKILGGHAVEIVGFNDRTQFIKFKNSWGDKLGDKGYFYMPYSYVLNPNYCSDFYVMETVQCT
jgi:C1A family cysteine protease